MLFFIVRFIDILTLCKMIVQVTKPTTATPSYKKVQAQQLRNSIIFAKSYFGQKLIQDILGVKGDYF